MREHATVIVSGQLAQRLARGPLSDVGSNRVAHEEFRWRVEQEAARHHRHLGGFGLVRIATRGGSLGRTALAEAIETETRRTDTVCLLPDGSYAVLVIHAETRELRLVAQRLRDTVRALDTTHVDRPHGVSAAIACCGQRRLTPDELWAATSRAFDESRRSGVEIVAAE